jgi:hypothetical protein
MALYHQSAALKCICTKRKGIKETKARGSPRAWLTDLRDLALNHRRRRDHCGHG